MVRAIALTALIIAAAVHRCVVAAPEIIYHEDESADHDAIMNDGGADGIAADWKPGDPGPAPGWRMRDRFAGFRFEVHGKVQGVWFRKRTQARADELACFGWVQNTARGTVVGEARCAKHVAPELKRWLARGPAGTGARVDRVEFLDYRDTKIMYHFTHFRVLPTRRLTCFEDGGPHGCARYEPALREGVYDGLDPLGTDPRADPLPAPAGAGGGPPAARRRDEL